MQIEEINDMSYSVAEVLSCELLSTGIYSMYLRTDAAAEAVPGQFVMLSSLSDSRLLMRPISICDADKDEEKMRLVFRVVGYATDKWTGLKSGDRLQLLGPRGNGFPIEASANRESIALVGGGVGIPPLLFLLKKLLENGNPAQNIHIILGYRSVADGLFLLDEFKDIANVIITTDDGSAGSKGTVLNGMKEDAVKPDIIYSCGPLPMLRALADYGKDAGIPVYVSMEERMACGVGVCLGCSVKTVSTDEHSKVKRARVCSEGPVFEGKDIDF